MSPCGRSLGITALFEEEVHTHFLSGFQIFAFICNTGQHPLIFLITQIVTLLARNCPCPYNIKTNKNGGKTILPVYLWNNTDPFLTPSPHGVMGRMNGGVVIKRSRLSPCWYHEPNLWATGTKIEPPRLQPNLERAKVFHWFLAPRGMPPCQVKRRTGRTYKAWGLSIEGTSLPLVSAKIIVVPPQIFTVKCAPAFDIHPFSRPFALSALLAR